MEIPVSHVPVPFSQSAKNAYVLIINGTCYITAKQMDRKYQKHKH